MEGTGPSVDGNGFDTWTKIWVRRLLRENFLLRLFLCGFHAIEEVQKVQCTAVEDLPPVIEADSIGQYRRREKQLDVNFFAKVLSVVAKLRVSKTANDVITCHHPLTGGKGTRFIRHDTEKNLKKTSIFVNDDLTPVRAMMTRDFRRRDDVNSVFNVNDKISVIMRQKKNKLVFDKFYKIQKWNIDLLSDAGKSKAKVSVKQ